MSKRLTIKSFYNARGRLKHPKKAQKGVGRYASCNPRAHAQEMSCPPRVRYYLQGFTTKELRQKLADMDYRGRSYLNKLGMARVLAREEKKKRIKVKKVERMARKQGVKKIKRKRLRKGAPQRVFLSF